MINFYIFNIFIFLIYLLFIIYYLLFIAYYPLFVIRSLFFYTYFLNRLFYINFCKFICKNFLKISWKIFKNINV